MTSVANIICLLIRCFEKDVMFCGVSPLPRMCCLNLIRSIRQYQIVIFRLGLCYEIACSTLQSVKEMKDKKTKELFPDLRILKRDNS